MEAALRHFAGRLLHTPSLRARELGRAGEAESVFSAVEALFDLNPARKSDTNTDTNTATNPSTATDTDCTRGSPG
ncbi:MAG: hypothetical protein ACTHW3_11195 [Leucobacter sp.]